MPISISIRQSVKRIGGALLCVIMAAPIAFAQDNVAVPPAVDPRHYDIVAAASSARLEADIRKLASFGTRNTFSDTVSPVIKFTGATRRRRNGNILASSARPLSTRWRISSSTTICSAWLQSGEMGMKAWSSFPPA